MRSPTLRSTRRAAARLAGLTKYDPGSPCKNGHVSARYVSSDQCMACDGQRYTGLAAGKIRPYLIALEVMDLPEDWYPILKAELERTAKIIVDSYYEQRAAAGRLDAGTEPAIAQSMPAEAPSEE